MNTIGKLGEGKPHAQFDEGCVETERWTALYGHEAGNSGYSQGRSCTPPRHAPTLLILCFQYREDAEKVLEVLAKRFAKYGLTLHSEKTRLIEFGREALTRSEAEGGKQPGTFDFLGFTHLCARSRGGKFTIHLRTMKKRLRRSTKAISSWCQRHRHDPVVEQWKALNAKLRGHYQYYGRPTNFRSIWKFYRAVRRIWRKWLNRRTRGKTVGCAVFEQILARLPLLLPCIKRSWCTAGSRV